jgi:TRAP-type C4-dicarboxylate transport system substrate-binding protein
MKWSKIGLCLWVMFGLAVFALTVETPAANAKIVTLTAATNTAPPGLKGKAEQLFFEEAEKHAGGKLKFQVYWGQSLLKGKEILKGTQDGVVDVGNINPNYYPKRMALNGGFSLISQGPTEYKNMHWAFSECYNKIPELKQEYDKYGLKVLYIYGLAPMSVTSSLPFTSFEDYKGKKIRASSRWVLGLLKGSGAIPVSVPWGDCYMALQTKSIDAVMTNSDAIHRVKLDEAAPNIFATKQLWSGSLYTYAISKRKWNKLPKDIQDALLKAGETAPKIFAKFHAKEWERVLSEQKASGYKVTLATDEDIKKWNDMPDHAMLQKEWATELEKAGVKDAAKVMERMKEIVAQGIAKDKK